MTQMQKDPETIHIVDIEKELAQLWKKHSEKGTTRASLFTLILYTHSPSRTQFFKEWLCQVIEKFPCRIIFIEKAGAEKKNFLKTQVTLESTEDADNKTCCDQIWIEASADQLEKIPFIILPHLLPDLPILLLWSQNPSTTDNIFPALSQYATRVIFDSDDSQSLQQFSVEVLEQMGCSSCNIADLNWARLKIWREAIYHAFSNPDLLKTFDQETQIVIEYNSISENSSLNPDLLAVYLQAWIAGRLGWKKGEIQRLMDKTKISFENLNGCTQVEILPKTRKDLPEGALLSYSVKSSDHEICLTRKSDERVLDIHVTTPSYCALPYQIVLNDLSRGHALVKELLFGCQSDHYASMLTTLSNLNWDNHDN